MATEDPSLEPTPELTTDFTPTSEPGERRSSGSKRRPPPPRPRPTTPSATSTSPSPSPSTSSPASTPTSSTLPPSASTISSSSTSTTTPVDKKTQEAIETVKYYLRQAIQIKDIQACKDLLTKAAALRMSGDLVQQAQTLILDKASEQRAEETETLKFYLKQGMDLKSRDALTMALEKVDKLSSNGATRRLNTEFYDLVTKARKELTRLNQEEAIVVVKALKDGIENRNREILLVSIKKADKISAFITEKDLVHQASNILAELDAQHLIKRILQQATEAKDLAALNSALSKADALKMAAKDHEEVAKAEKLLPELKKKDAKKKKKMQEKMKTRSSGKGTDFILFGGDLAHAVKQGGKEVPLICYDTIEFLKAKGVLEPGLFRLSGNADSMEEIKYKYSVQQEVKLTDVHDAAGVFKQYLRKLPEPLVPFSHYPDFIKVGNIPPKEPARNAKLKELIQKLPKDNLALLNYLMKFLKEVADRSDINKMTPDNLAIVFAPNLLRPKTETPTSMMVEMPISIGLVATFISSYDELFETSTIGCTSSTSSSSSSSSSSSTPSQSSKEEE